MSPFDYAIGLVSILIGLALTDVAASLHRLLRLGRSVRWDGRVVLSVILIIMTIVGMWFEIWMIRNVKAVLSFPFYFTLFLQFMLLYLLCAACLPDEVGDKCDLGKFYASNTTYLWSLFGLFQAGFFFGWIYFAVPQYTHHTRMLLDGALLVLPVAISILLILIRLRWVHYSALLILIA